MDRKRQLAMVAGLVCLSGLVQVVLIRHATVPSLDAVRFVETAQSIGRQGLAATMRTRQEQPLFPASVWLVHEGLQRTTGRFRPDWVGSVQWAAAIPLVLAVVPVYFLSVRLVGPAAGLAGSVLFCILPEVARLGADGISDGTHLLFFCLALWAMVAYLGGARGEGTGDREQGLGARDEGRGEREEGGKRPPTARGGVPLRRRTRSAPGHPLWLLAAGAATALALLARAEVLVLPLALIGALLLFQFRADWRQPWSRRAAAAGCLVLGFGLVYGPYLVAMGALTPRVALSRALGREHPGEPAARSPRPAPAATGDDRTAWCLDGGEPMSFAAKDPATSIRRRGYLAAAGRLPEELAGAFGYGVGALALFGLWRLRRAAARPVDRFVQIFVVLFLLAVVHFAAGEGYLSSRHLLSLVVVGVGLAGYGGLEAGGWIANGVGSLFRPARVPLGGSWTEKDSRPRSRCDPKTGRFEPGSPLAWTVLLLAAVACGMQLVEPLHATRLGHRRAGQWLATCADAPGAVLDTRGWTGLYSGRKTYRYDDAREAFADPKLAYVVLERRELGFPGGRSRTLRYLLEVAGEPVAAFSESESPGQARRTVVVYRWNAERFSRWLATRRVLAL